MAGRAGANPDGNRRRIYTTINIPLPEFPYLPSEAAKNTVRHGHFRPSNCIKTKIGRLKTQTTENTCVHESSKGHLSSHPPSFWAYPFTLQQPSSVAIQATAKPTHPNLRETAQAQTCPKSAAIKAVHTV